MTMGHEKYGACRRAREDVADFAASRRRVQRAIMYCAASLLILAVASVLAAGEVHEASDTPIRALQKLLGSLVFNNSPATIQSASAIPAETLQPPPGFVDARPSPPPGFQMAYQAALAGGQPTAVIVPPVLMQPTLPYASSNAQVYSSGQATAPRSAQAFVEQPLPTQSKAVLPAPVTPWSGVRTSAPTQFPVGFFEGEPVWTEMQGAAYVDQPAPATAATSSAVPFFGNQQAQSLKLPAAAAVERLLAARRASMAQPVGAIGVAQPVDAMTGDAATEYGLAFGAAFASTYNAMMQGLSTSDVKQKAIQRLTRKAQDQPVKPKAPLTRTVQVTLPQPGWSMPPLARTGTALVEQSLMSPAEVQQQQQNIAGTESVNIMSATGGPTVTLNSEQKSAFRVNAQGQWTYSQPEEVPDAESEEAPQGPQPAPAAQATPRTEAAGDAEAGVEQPEVGPSQGQDPLEVAQSAVSRAVSLAEPGRMQSLSELV